MECMIETFLGSLSYKKKKRKITNFYIKQYCITYRSSQPTPWSLVCNLPVITGHSQHLMQPKGFLSGDKYQLSLPKQENRQALSDTTPYQVFW